MVESVPGAGSSHPQVLQVSGIDVPYSNNVPEMSRVAEKDRQGRSLGTHGKLIRHFIIHAKDGLHV